MTCTKCRKPITRGHSYYRTQKGPHHANCQSGTTTQDHIEVYAAIGKVLRIRRGAVGLTADSLASEAMVSRAQISNIELGNCGCTLHVLIGAARALRCKAWEILRDADL